MLLFTANQIQKKREYKYQEEKISGKWTVGAYGD